MAAKAIEEMDSDEEEFEENETKAPRRSIIDDMKADKGGF